MARQLSFVLGLALLVGFGGTPIAGATLNDSTVELWVSRLQFEPNDPFFTGFEPNTPVAGRLTIGVEVRKGGPDPFQGGTIPIVLKRNGQVLPIPLNITDPNQPSQELSTLLTLEAGDFIEAEVDPNDVLEECAEENNRLGMETGDDPNNPCAPYPKVVTFNNPLFPVDVIAEMQCVKCETKATEPFPFALLVLPPYDCPLEAQGGADVSTNFTQTTEFSTEDSSSTGFTAGIAVEVEFGIPFAAEVNFGLSVDASFDETEGVSTSLTSSLPFTAADMACLVDPDPNDPDLPDHVVVMTQTHYEVCEYEVTDASDSGLIGKRVWTGGPSDRDAGPVPIPNPVLYSIFYSCYQIEKSDQAVDLQPVLHIPGSKAGYGDNAHGLEHLAQTPSQNPNPGPQCQSIGGENLIAGSARFVTETPDQTFSQTLASGKFTGTSVAVATTAHAGISLGVVSVEASFGTMNGSSHQIFEGIESGFTWGPPPVNPGGDRHWVVGYAANLHGECNDKPKQKLLLVDYYLVNTKLQSQDQQNCINELNKGLAKIAKAEGKHICKCIKAGAKGQLTSKFGLVSIEQCIQELPASKSGSKVLGTISKTSVKAAAKCPEPPDFGASDPNTVRNTVLNKEVDLIHEMFGSDLDEAIITEGEGKDASKCQQKVAKAAKKCQDAKLKAFNKCKKDGLKGNNGPAFSSGAMITARCMTPTIADPKQKIEKACVTKLNDTISSKCGDDDLVDGFGGGDCAAEATAGATELGTCLDRLVECRVCRALNAADNLARDCDEFDDGTVNGSCKLPL